MNEQLIVKNFGPITDATVDFKRVTVFIGPTGGGKSTLAKLAGVMRDSNWLDESDSSRKRQKFTDELHHYQIGTYLKNQGTLIWKSSVDEVYYDGNLFEHTHAEKHNAFERGLDIFSRKAREVNSLDLETIFSASNDEERIILSKMHGFREDVHYMPADRAFAAAIERGLAGLTIENVSLPETLLDFINDYSRAVGKLKSIPLSIDFLNIRYQIVDGEPKILLKDDIAVDLPETASGIQAVAPMLLLIGEVTRSTPSNSIPKLFIIEEPELNLYPTAQQGLLNWLVEKCTKGENDLTITTHSPYILSHLNLLLYAYQVAEQHPDRREAVAAIVPEASWINPKEFACYQVENGGVQSLVDTELGLIDNNELDGLSGDAADAFDNLIRLSKGFAIK